MRGIDWVRINNKIQIIYEIMIIIKYERDDKDQIKYERENEDQIKYERENKN